MFGHSFAKNTVKCTVKPLHLVGGWFVRCCPKFLHTEQSTDFSHYPSIDLFTLVAEDREGDSELAKDLFYQDLSDGLSLLASEREGFCPFSKRIHTG